MVTSKALPFTVGDTAVQVELSKSDGSEWTDEEINSLYMVADGVLLTTEVNSSVDFKNGNTVVASIWRDYYGKTIATLYCNQSVFGPYYEYAVSYLGWDEPTMPSVVAIPELPQVINGTDRTLYLRKGDNSNWSESDVQNLKIKIGNDVCDVVTTETGYDFSLNGQVYCNITSSQVSGARIPLFCQGIDGERQPMYYTLTSIDIETPVPYIITNPATPIVIDGSNVNVNLSKRDSSNWDESEIQHLKIIVNGNPCTINIGSTITIRSSSEIGSISRNGIGTTQLTATFLGTYPAPTNYTVNSIDLDQ